MYSLTELPELEKHLAKMAENGWLVTKVGIWGCAYKSVPPRRLKFGADLLTNITAVTYPENEDAKDYRALCEESGWTFACASKQLQIFYIDADNGEAFPLQTDETVKAANLLKMTGKYEAPFVYIGLIYLIYSFTQIANNGWGVFATNLSLGQFLGTVVWTPALLWYAAYLTRCRYRLRKCAKGVEPLYKSNARLIHFRTKFFLGSAALAVSIMLIGAALDSPAMLIYVLAPVVTGFGAGFIIRKQVDSKRRSEKANAALAIVGIIALALIAFVVSGALIYPALKGFRNNSLPADMPALRLTDIGIDSAPRNSAYWDSSSVLMRSYTYYESNQEGNARTEWTQTAFKFLTRGLLEKELAEQDVSRHMTDAEIAEWSADDGYALSESKDWSSVLLVYGNTFVRIDFSSEAECSPNQIVRSLGLL
jgi:hypothetical protein